MPQKLLRESIPLRIDLELTTACDHRCRYCYNVWGAKEGDFQAGFKSDMLPASEFISMVRKIVSQSGAESISITGGEPLIRPDAIEIITEIASFTPSVQLVTNGSHVSSEIAQKLSLAKVRSVQMTLLSANREKHDFLKGAKSFDDTLRAVMNLRDAKVPCRICFVSTKENFRDFSEVMELCHVMGIRSISYNRMCPTGGSIHTVDSLLPDAGEVESNLNTAESLGRKYGIRVNTAIPIPPCLIRVDRYKWIKFGFCSVGGSTINFVVDAGGNVRSCNLSSTVLGNFRKKNWNEILTEIKKYRKAFNRQIPALCRKCRYRDRCRGGCKESGFAMYGSPAHPEPFIHKSLQTFRTT